MIASHPTAMNGFPAGSREPIAIIGIGCHFPGGADNAERFWKLLVERRTAMIDVPPDRWNASRFYSSEPGAPGKMYVRTGGFLQQPIAAFDPMFFGISPKQAQYLDPQQRLVLEVTCNALEDAGLTPLDYRGSQTAVFMGAFAMDAMALQLSPLNRRLIQTHHGTTASSMTMLANRLSYFFDLRGPSVALDTACSSSLVAVHYACESLWSGECSMALAGGVNLMICPQVPMVMCKGHFLAPDGLCKSFDYRADGYARGEGCGIVVLKSLQTALQDEDAIYAVIRGTGVNQDGRSEGITVPSPAAQEALIRSVFDRAGVEFSRIKFVEAHGTGTPIGDPVEAAVLGRTIGSSRMGGTGCPVASVKGNIGHLESAAGVAGLIKAALCLHKRMVPPQANFVAAGPDIPLDELGLRVPTECEPIARDEEPACAAVNSFGYGGTNAHALLEEFDQAQRFAGTDSPAVCLLPLSARSQGALTALTAAYASWLREVPDTAIADISFSAGARRTHYEHRLTIVCNTTSDAARELEKIAESGSTDSALQHKCIPASPFLPVFVFTGMGPQWWGMGQELLRDEPVFRRAAEECDELFRLRAGWSVLEGMRASESNSRISEAYVAQPANLVLQIALAALWRSWGIRPAAVAGHSAGEVAAAYVAGSLNLEDAIRVIWARSSGLQAIQGTGKMLAAGIAFDCLTPMLAGRDSQVCVAAVNSPYAVTLSGDAKTLDEIAAEFDSRGIYCRLLDINVPYHSPAADALLGPLERAVAGINVRRGTTPIYSTVTGALAGPEDFGASYWSRNMRSPVLFAQAVNRMLEDGYRMFLEVGPHPVLGPSIAECSERVRVSTRQFSSLRRGHGERASLMRALGAMYTCGAEPEWRNLYRAAHYVRLPNYAWQRQEYWLETDTALADRLAGPEHPILGNRLPVGTPVWEFDGHREDLRYLFDHVVDGAAILPAAYVEAGLAIRKLNDGQRAAMLEDLAFLRVFTLDSTDTILHWTYNEESREYQARSKTDGSDAWTLHARGRISASAPPPAPMLDVGEIRSRCTEELDRGCFYDALQEHGLGYKTSFRSIERLWRGANESLAEICAPDSVACLLDARVLDGAFQAVIASLRKDSPLDTSVIYIPVGIRRVRFYGRGCGSVVWAHAHPTRVTPNVLEADVELIGDDGSPLAFIDGLRCSMLEPFAAGRRRREEDWLYTLRWEKTEPIAVFADPSRWLLLADGTSGYESSLAEYLRSQAATEVMCVYQADAYDRNGSQFRIRRGNRDDIGRLLRECGIETLRGVVCFWAIDASEHSEDPAGIHACADALHLLQELSQLDLPTHPRLLFVTAGAETAAGFSQTSLSGFVRTAACEFPELRCTTIDLDGNDPRVVRRLGAELLGGEEDEVSFRSGERYVRRLARLNASELEQSALERRAVPAETGIPFTTATRFPGRLDSLCFRGSDRRAPRPDELEVQVSAAALNFKDVLKASGLLPETAVEGTFHGMGLGMEAAGTVLQTGAAVQGFAAGERIVASLPNSFSSYVTVREDQLFAMRCPDGIDFREAVTMPVAFLTAYYALNDVARLRSGETVLIHAAAGGVGLAAIQVAEWLGARVLATAGSEEKRNLLRRAGISHVWNSRDLSFADGALDVTRGRGVDVLLNSLPGEALVKSLAIMAPFGRFVEIGKRDIIENNRMPMMAFNRNLSFTAIDLDRMMMEQPQFVRRLLRDVWERVVAGDFRPLPANVFPAARISEAFRCMQQAKHTGKIVIDLSDLAGVRVLPVRGREKLFGPDGTYVVTGGLGGVGLHLARWLCDEGVRQIAIITRRSSCSGNDQDAIQEIESRGACVRVLTADVGDAGQLAQVFAEIDRSMPGVRGVFHLAAVIDDDWIQHLDAERLEVVMRAKALGAWNLHRATMARPLDHFVLFSSAAGWLGNPGQAAYAAANSFLDGLASARRAEGLPGNSIAWGAIGDTGMVARNDALKLHLEKSGIREIPIADAFAHLRRALYWDMPQIAIIDADWGTWSRVHPIGGTCPRFKLVACSAGNESSNIWGLLLTLEPAERIQRLSTAMAEALANILGVETIDIRQPLTQLGIDSLVGMEMRTTIKATLGVELSILDLVKGNTLEGIAKRVSEKLAPGSAAGHAAGASD